MRKFVFCLISLILMVATSVASGLSGQVTTRGVFPTFPVAGATVVVSRIHKEKNPVAVVQTDANGNYSVSNLGADTYVVQFSKPGYLQGVMDGYALPANTNVTLNAQLVPALTGTEIPQANEKDEHTWTIHNPNPFTVSYVWKLPNPHVSGTGSAYPGDTVIDTGIRPHTEHIHLFVAGVEVQPISTTTVPPPGTTGLINGTVIDANTNGALGNVEVDLLDSSSNVLMIQHSGANGAYSFSGVTAGTYTLSFSLSGYVSQTLSGIAVSANVVSTVNAALTPISPPQLASVNITVVETDDQSAIGGTTVQIAYSTGPIYSGFTDGNGLVVFSNQPVGVSATILVTTNDGSGRSASQTTSGWVSGPNSVIIGIAPIPRGTISGSVTDNSSIALAQVLVTVLDGNNNAVASTSTLVDGSYTTPTLNVGTYFVSFSKSGYQTVTFNGVSVLSGATTTQNAVLTPNAPVPASLNLTVLDGGTFGPIANATVTLSYAGAPNPTPSGNTDGNGLVHFDGLNAQGLVSGLSVTFVVAVNDPFGRTSSQTITLAAGANPVTVVINPAPMGNLSGNVTSFNGGGALSGVLVTVTDANNNTAATATTDASGNYSIPNLETVTYTITFSKSGYQNNVVAGVSITAGNTTTQNATLSPPPNPMDSTVTVSVVDSSGSLIQISGMTVNIVFADGSRASTVTDSNGLATFTNQLVGVAATITVDTNEGPNRSGSLAMPNGFTSGSNPPVSVTVQ